MRIYAFEDIDEKLDAVPLAATRALETAGCKLSLPAWRKLRGPARVAITSIGSQETLDTARVRDLLAGEKVRFARAVSVREPPARSIPADVARALGPSRELGAAAWRAITPLDRYVLARLAQRGGTKLRRAYEEITGKHESGSRAISTHLNARGEVHMVDVGGKDVTVRHAAARARVRMHEETAARLRAGATPKGDVLATARIAAIMAAKRTPEIIPLCHAIALTRVDVDIALAGWGVTVDVRVQACDRTGAEMEAMVAASAAALTIYDMLKGMDRGITFEVALMAKSGGKSGSWTSTRKK